MRNSLLQNLDMERLVAASFPGEAGVYQMFLKECQNGQNPKFAGTGQQMLK